MTLEIESATKKNNISKYSKPNEDYFVIDAELGVFLITDGVSRDLVDDIYPNPSPSSEVAEILSNAAFNYIKTHIDHTRNFHDLLFNAFKTGNEALKQYNCKYATSGFIPGAVSLAAIIRKSTVFFCYLGDVSLRKVSLSNNLLLTKSQTEKFRKYSKSFSRSFVRNHICNNRQHPLSYGVFTGEENALSFLTFNQIEIEIGDELHFITDGLDCFYDMETPNKWVSSSVNQIINSAEEIELKFKDSINSDDKTIIKVKLKFS